MELIVLDENIDAVTVLDSFESLIWTDRYCGFGDFEIYAKASEYLRGILKEDHYLWSSDSEHVMIIEQMKLKTNSEDGNHMIFTGRSLESILDRRIIATQTVLTGNLQNGIKKLLDENVISPTDTSRQIPNFVFEVSTDPVITALTVNAQFTYDNLYEAVFNLCKANDIGFKITLSELTNEFVFKLYAGVDRSYSQIANPYVVFSPKYDNLVNSDYTESKKQLRTVTLVAGEGDGLDRKTTTVGSGSGMNRRELYTDARDLSQTVDGVLIPEATYLAQLAQRGTENLAGYPFIKNFDSQVDTKYTFKYGTDFFIGDIVQIENDYSIQGTSRVTEVIHSQSVNGIEIYPTFTIIE